MSLLQRHLSSMIDIYPNLLFSWLIILFLPDISYSLCYFPDGSVASGDSPCYSSGNSTCCGRGFACLSNNVCMLTDQVVGAGPGQSTYIRGSCTDKSWNDPSCPQFCVSSARGDCLSCAMGMARCPGTTSDIFFVRTLNQTMVKTLVLSVQHVSHTLLLLKVSWHKITSSANLYIP